MRDKFYYLGKNVELYTINFGTEPYLVSIHDNVIVAAGVNFVNHDVSVFNVARLLGLRRGDIDKVGSIELFENCFIGTSTILMPNCSVGKNSVIAAGSIVTKHVPDNEVCYRRVCYGSISIKLSKDDSETLPEDGWPS